MPDLIVSIPRLVQTAQVKQYCYSKLATTDLFTAFFHIYYRRARWETADLIPGTDFKWYVHFCLPQYVHFTKCTASLLPLEWVLVQTKHGALIGKRCTVLIGTAYEKSHQTSEDLKDSNIYLPQTMTNCTQVNFNQYSNCWDISIWTEEGKNLCWKGSHGWETPMSFNQPTVCSGQMRPHSHKLLINSIHELLLSMGFNKKWMFIYVWKRVLSACMRGRIFQFVSWQSEGSFLFPHHENNNEVVVCLLLVLCINWCWSSFLAGIWKASIVWGLFSLLDLERRPTKPSLSNYCAAATLCWTPCAVTVSILTPC